MSSGNTLWWTYKKLLKMAIEIVDFPIKNGGSFHGKMLVHQGNHPLGLASTQGESQPEEAHQMDLHQEVINQKSQRTIPSATENQQLMLQIDINIDIDITIYIYTYMYVCVCVLRMRQKSGWLPHCSSWEWPSDQSPWMIFPPCFMTQG